MDVAIVGPDQAGKSTLFEALAAGHAQHGDARAEHLATVKVPDERLDRVADLIKPKKATSVELVLHDLPTLFEKGRAASGEAAESLARADGLILVVRAFQRADVPHPRGEVDAGRDIEEFFAEMALNDLAIVERRLGKLDMTVRSGSAGEREAARREQALLERVHKLLEAGRPLRGEFAGGEDVKALSNFGLLTLKPVLVLVNLDEADIPRTVEIESEYRARFSGPGVTAAAMCARLEAELGELEASEAAEFRREMGAPQGETTRVLGLALEALGLVTFFTAGDNECRAWAVPAGTTALEAAGRIHTDMERGFIRAEVIRWDELVEAGGFAEAKKHGQLRSEGKVYHVQDGDVVHVLFSV